MSLAERLQQPNILIAPGVADTLGAVLAERAGFEAVFLSGSAMAYTHLGRPDIGLVSLGEVVDITRRIAERSEIAVVVDADSGFGNAYYVHRAVRALELAGASGIQIEDQINDKHPSEVGQRPVIPLADMLVKLRAALDARRNSSTLISARSDVAVSQGVSAALDRAAAFMETGVDMVFIEGLHLTQDRQRLAEHLAEHVDHQLPMLYNLAWAGKDPTTNASACGPTIAELNDEGYAIALAPTVIVGAAMRAANEALDQLATQQPATQPVRQSTGQAIPDSMPVAVAADPYLEKLKRWSHSDDSTTT